MNEGSSSHGLLPSQTGAKGAQERVSTDAILLEDLRAGHAAAFEQLFERHYGRVYYVLYRLVADRADDLAQEVFLQLYHRPPSASDTDLSAWLFRVATNLGYNALRTGERQQRYRRIFGALTRGLGWHHAEPDPQVAIERKEEQERVRSTLASLRKRQASLLVLRYSGLSYREIADALAISPRSVGTLLARAERSFKESYERQAFQREGGEENDELHQ